MRTAAPNHSIVAQRLWRDGVRQARAGRWDAAARAYAKAHRLQPGDALYGANLADALIKLGRIEDGIAAARAALRAEPGSTIALALLTHGLQAACRHEDVVSELSPGMAQGALSPELLRALAAAQLHLGRPQAAVTSFLAALAKDPTHGPSHYHLGVAFNGLGLKLEAAECFRTALLLGVGPLEVGIRDLLCFYEREACDWKQATSSLQRVEQNLRALSDDAAVEVNPFVHATLLADAALQLRAARAIGRWMARGVQPLPARRPVRRERIRIGYVSADIHAHATAYLMSELVERHRRDRFEVFLYSHGRDDGSDVRRRIQGAVEHFVECRDMSLPEMARRVRDDGIDVLIDLKGFTKDARPALFVHRAAPVQVSYLGFPGTTGIDAMDYVIGDPIVTPLAHAGHFSESIAQLPWCYQCNDGQRSVPVAPSRASQGLPQDALVLCGFNQPYKISPQVMDLWCRLLHRLPGSVLWLLDWNEQATRALRRESEVRGVDGARLVFAPSIKQAAHLDRIGCADLFLDTWPCNGHTTASDMLWAGVPVVTCLGETFAARVAASLLTAIGLSGEVCQDLVAYEARVIELAGDQALRAGLRAKVEAARLSAPLFNGALLASELESLYERMWDRALAGLPPTTLPARTVPGQQSTAS